MVEQARIICLVFAGPLGLERIRFTQTNGIDAAEEILDIVAGHFQGRQLYNISFRSTIYNGKQWEAIIPNKCESYVKHN